MSEKSVPRAASSMELPWPMTTVSMRLINGPQIHIPIAGPVNFTISFICSHMLCFTRSPLCFSSSSSSSISRSIPTQLLVTRSNLILRRVTTGVPWKLGVAVIAPSFLRVSTDSGTSVWWELTGFGLSLGKREEKRVNLWDLVSIL